MTSDTHLQPDRPQPFGYKNAWLALRTTDTQAVVASLGLLAVRPSGWGEGVAQAYERKVFVSPSLLSWTLAVGLPLAPPNEPMPFVKPLLERLSRRFGEAQYFCTHRVVEVHIWARALRGTLVRGYAWLGERGETLWDAGGQTQHERDLGFRFFDERSDSADDANYWARKDLGFPDEECVMRLAGAWSIDPASLDRQFEEPGLGVLGEFRGSEQGPDR